MLTFAASDDQQALMLHVPVTALVSAYRLLLPFGSVGVGVLAAILARESRSRRDEFGGAREPKRVVALRRNAKGGFDAEAPKST